MLAKSKVNWSAPIKSVKSAADKSKFASKLNVSQPSLSLQALVLESFSTREHSRSSENIHCFINA